MFSHVMLGVIDYCLMAAIFQIYHGNNNLIFNEMMMMFKF